MSGRAAVGVDTRRLLLGYSFKSSDQLVELYCRRVECVVTIYSKCVAE